MSDIYHSAGKNGISMKGKRIFITSKFFETQFMTPFNW